MTIEAKHTMVASHHEMEIEGTEKKVLEAEPDIDWMAQQVQDFFKSRNFYEMDLTWQ